MDVENSDHRARPWIRKMAATAAAEGAPVTSDNIAFEFHPGGLDLTAPADRALLARRVEQARPDLIMIGPLYKLTMSGKSDEEAAKPLMSALEMLRTASNGAAMLIEAHSPHAAPGVKRRDLRPIGSSLWLRWPEFGFGLSPASELGAAEQRLMDWVPWRGQRSERSWPEQFCEGATWPWQAIDYAGNGPLHAITLTEEQVAALSPEELTRFDMEQTEVFSALGAPVSAGDPFPGQIGKPRARKGAHRCSGVLGVWCPRDGGLVASLSVGGARTPPSGSGRVTSWLVRSPAAGPGSRSGPLDEATRRGGPDPGRGSRCAACGAARGPWQACGWVRPLGGG